MKRIFSKKGCAAVVLLVTLAGVVAYLTLFRQQPPDTRYNGAYRLEDGRLVFVVPSDGEVLRYRMMSGQSSAMWPVGNHSFESGPGWREREPVEIRIEFQVPGDGGPPKALTWKPADEKEQAGSRIALPEVLATIPAGELELRAKLVLPLGEPPFPVVVLVHGSGKDSAVDTYYHAYLFAAHGIATLAYDKRGTGGSTGEFDQNFHHLSDDTVGVVEWLRTRPEIDSRRIHLAGYSQGGWISPLAASKTPGIRSLLINYGPMVPITEEDRWGYRYALYDKGFGEDAVAKVDEINQVLSAIVDRGEDRWAELADLLEEAEGQDWFEAVTGSDSMVGFVAASKLPLWVLRLYAWWMMRGMDDFVDRLYDPVPVVGDLDVPSLWIFGGEDSSMPSQDSIDELIDLQQQGRPIEIEIFPEAEHGILLFEDGTSEDRQYLGYAPGYLDLQVQWLREQSDLPGTVP